MQYQTAHHDGSRSGCRPGDTRTADTRPADDPAAGVPPVCGRGSRPRPAARRPGRWRGWLPTAVFFVLLAACASAPERTEGTSFIIVRHAEKAQDNPADPSLSEAGRRRALALATRLREEPLTAVYATQWLRTRQTAAPAADARGLPVRTYDAGEPAGELAARLRRDHRAGAVLVVGHSNTVPDLVAALCRCEVAPIDESVYGDLFLVTGADDARPRLVHERF